MAAGLSVLLQPVRPVECESDACQRVKLSCETAEDTYIHVLVQNQELAPDICSDNPTMFIWPWKHMATTIYRFQVFRDKNNKQPISAKEHHPPHQHWWRKPVPSFHGWTGKIRRDTKLLELRKSHSLLRKGNRIWNRLRYTKNANIKIELWTAESMQLFEHIFKGVLRICFYSFCSCFSFLSWG